jgi:hypothetical protein
MVHCRHQGREAEFYTSNLNSEISNLRMMEKSKIVSTYRAGQARPWTMVKSITSHLHSQINIFLVTFCNPRYHLSCSWICRLESFSYFLNRNFENLPQNSWYGKHILAKIFVIGMSAMTIDKVESQLWRSKKLKNNFHIYIYIYSHQPK